MSEIALTDILHDGELIGHGSKVDALPDSVKATLREVGAIGEVVLPKAVADEMAEKDAQIAELLAKLEATKAPTK